MSGVTAAFAQKPEDKKWDPEKRMEHEMKRLNEAVPGLTDEQKKEIKAINQSQMEKMKDMREENMEEREEMREKRSEIMQEKLEGYKKVLSKEQYVQLLEYMVTHPHHKGHGHKGRHGKP